MVINNKIFVYGTLMDSMLKDAFPKIDLHIRKRKNGKINARLFDIGEYPGGKAYYYQIKRGFWENL